MARNWHPASLNRMRKCLDSERAISSKTRCLAVWFTMPGKTQYSTALRIMVLFDLAVGCLNNLGPGAKETLIYYNCCDKLCIIATSEQHFNKDICKDLQFYEMFGKGSFTLFKQWSPNWEASPEEVC